MNRLVNLNCARVMEANYIDLSSNNLDGPLPLLPTTLKSLKTLFLNNKIFSGPLPQNIDKLAPLLSYLDLSTNSIEGRLPSTISKLKMLAVLSVKNNILPGELQQN